MASQELTEDFRGTDTSPLPDVYDDLTGQVSGPVTGLTLGTQNWSELNESFGSATGSFRCAASGTLLAPPTTGQARYAKLTFSSLNHTAGVTTFEARLVPGMAMTGQLGSGATQFGIDVTLTGSGTIEWDFTPIHTFTGATPGALVTLRVEIESGTVRFYVDGTLKHTKSGGVAYSTAVDFIQLEMPGFYTAHGRPVGVLAVALDAFKLKTETTTGSLLPAGPGPDTTAPVFSSTTIDVAALYTEYTAEWSLAIDDVDLLGTVTYEYRINGGSYTSTGTTRTLTRTGLAPNTIETLEVRAKDAAGNYTAPISVVASTYALPTEKGLFSDVFTTTGTLRGSSGQTGIWARSPWVAEIGTNGSGTIAGNFDPLVQRDPTTDSFRRTPLGLEWTADGDYGLVYGYASASAPSVAVELPVVMEVAGYGDFRAGYYAADGGGSSGSAGVGIYNMAGGGGRIEVFGGGTSLGAGWTWDGIGTNPYKSIPTVVGTQLYTIRTERTLTSLTVYLDGVLMGTASLPAPTTPRIGYWELLCYTTAESNAHVVLGQATSEPGTTVKKFRYFNLRSGRLTSGPLGMPRDPNDDEPIDPDEPPGPNNEPTSDYALFWTNFNSTYEVP